MPDDKDLLIDAKLKKISRAQMIHLLESGSESSAIRLRYIIQLIAPYTPRIYVGNNIAELIPAPHKELLRRSIILWIEDKFEFDKSYTSEEAYFLSPEDISVYPLNLEQVSDQAKNININSNNITNNTTNNIININIHLSKEDLKEGVKEELSEIVKKKLQDSMRQNFHTIGPTFLPLTELVKKHYSEASEGSKKYSEDQKQDQE